MECFDPVGTIFTGYHGSIIATFYTTLTDEKLGFLENIDKR